MIKSFDWTRPRSLAEALPLLDGKAAVKAGGIDLLDLMKDNLAAPSRLVALGGVGGLSNITVDANGTLHLGPLVTLAQLAADSNVRKRTGILADAAGQAATPQVRNMATLGGNLLQRPRCWYFRNEAFHCRKKGGETCFAHDGENQYHAIFNNTECAIVHPSACATPLVALNATIELTSAKGKRLVPAEQFFHLPSVNMQTENDLAPGEILTQVNIPPLADGAVQAYLRQGEKQSFDWPVAEVAVVMQMKGADCLKASIILGAAAPVPHRAIEAESELNGKTVSLQTAQAAARAAMAHAAPLSQNKYKVPVFEAMIRRTILAAVAIAQAGVNQP